MAQTAPRDSARPARRRFRLELTGAETDRLHRLAEAEGVSAAAALREIVRERLGDAPSADDLAGGLAGSLAGPTDLASNPAHLSGFGA